MSRQIPMAVCLSLLKTYAPNDVTPQQTIATAAAVVEAALSARALADLNDGQFAALIDYAAWQGEATFNASPIRTWAANGNLTLPMLAMGQIGERGVSERLVWNLGNSL